MWREVVNNGAKNLINNTPSTVLSPRAKFLKDYFSFLRSVSIESSRFSPSSASGERLT